MKVCRIGVDHPRFVATLKHDVKNHRLTVRSPCRIICHNADSCRLQLGLGGYWLACGQQPPCASGSWDHRHVSIAVGEERLILRINPVLFLTAEDGYLRLIW